MCPYVSFVRLLTFFSVVLSLGVTILLPLPTEPSRKKKRHNEAEIALRGEKTDHKRKNTTEKKLEDEKLRFLLMYQVNS
jgi:hypothetical protein